MVSVAKLVLQHEKVRYPCDECDYHANTTSHLKGHKESKHKGVKYSCDECEYFPTRPGHWLWKETKLFSPAVFESMSKKNIVLRIKIDKFTKMFLRQMNNHSFLHWGFGRNNKSFFTLWHFTISSFLKFFLHYN